MKRRRRPSRRLSLGKARREGGTAWARGVELPELAEAGAELDGLARGLDKPIVSINLFETARLDLALGRTNVIHAALHAGPPSAAFLARVARLTSYRSGVDVLAGVDVGTGTPLATDVGDGRLSDSRDEI